MKTSHSFSLRNWIWYEVTTNECCLSGEYLQCQAAALQKYRTTLPETNCLPLKMDAWNTSFLFGWPVFRGEPLVSGRVWSNERLDPKNHPIGIRKIILSPNLHDFGWTWVNPLIFQGAWKYHANSRVPPRIPTPPPQWGNKALLFPAGGGIGGCTLRFPWKYEMIHQVIKLGDLGAYSDILQVKAKFWKYHLNIKLG